MCLNLVWSAWCFCLFSHFLSPCWAFDEQRSVTDQVNLRLDCSLQPVNKDESERSPLSHCASETELGFSLWVWTGTSAEINQKMMMQHSIDLMQPWCTVCEVQLARSKHNPLCMCVYVHVRALGHTAYCGYLIVQMEETAPAVSPNVLLFIDSWGKNGKKRNMSYIFTAYIFHPWISFVTLYWEVVSVSFKLTPGGNGERVVSVEVMNS